MVLVVIGHPESSSRSSSSWTWSRLGCLQTRRRFPRSVTRLIVEPLYAPIYAILGRSQLGGLDFSPMIMLLLLNYIVGTLNGRG
jgi:hypothetical protein